MKNRIQNCSEELKKIGYDAFLISSPVNIQYLSNFRIAEGYLIITADAELIYFTNFLYEEEAKKINIWKLITSNGKNIFYCIVEQIKKRGFKKVGFEAKNLAFLEYKKIKELLNETKTKFIPNIDLVEKIRSIKSNEEIKNIKKAIAISQEAFEFVFTIYQDNMSEKDLSIEIEKFLKIKGDNSIAFSPIVAYDKNTAYPHYLPKDATGAKKSILIDLGAKYLNYCADLTRIFLKDKINNFYKKIFKIVKDAQEYAILKIRDGIRANEVDKAARNFIEKKGYGKYFGHGLGHGVGLQVHELPYLNPYNKEPLKEGMVLTIEPAIYLAGRFGIRLEDIVLVKSKNAEILSGNKLYIFD